MSGQILCQGQLEFSNALKPHLAGGAHDGGHGHLCLRSQGIDAHRQGAFWILEQNRNHLLLRTRQTGRSRLQALEQVRVTFTHVQ
jgi:hypothetical protein